jgi:ATP-dependent DNA helicase PIF1
MTVVDGICANCRKVDKKRESNEPYLFTAENLADPGPFPQPAEGPLPELTQFEEMLIARVHIYMEIRQHRGQQYKYRGHICNFLCDSGRIYDELPLLPRELNVLVPRPARSKDDPRVQRQFSKNYIVRRWAVLGCAKVVALLAKLPPRLSRYPYQR